jgi:TonB family protein
VKPLFPAGLRSAAFKPVTIDVRVAIDQKGRVTRAEPVSTGSPYRVFVIEAVRAARLWQFQPARRGEEPVESQIVLQFVFSQ